MQFCVVVLVCLATLAHAQSWTLTGDLTYARAFHTATLLPNGDVLVAAGYGSAGIINSAELYNPTTGVWTVTADLAYARSSHTATLLPNGNVLVAGGQDNNGNPINRPAELYNSRTGSWIVTGILAFARYDHTATLLPNGNVLVAGGTTDYSSSIGLNTAELYNAITGLWTVTGNLVFARFRHTATLLPNGNVLVAGGDIIGKTAESYNATTGVWTLTSSLTNVRSSHTATLLPNGDVLVAAGASANENRAELYNPTSSVWTVIGSLTYARFSPTATLLPNGNVLVAAGEYYNGEYNYLNSAELYNTTTGVWTLTGSLKYGRAYHTATLLPNGNVLIAGGYNSNNLFLNSAELYL